MLSATKTLASIPVPQRVVFASPNTSDSCFKRCRPSLSKNFIASGSEIFLLLSNCIRTCCTTSATNQQAACVRLGSDDSIIQVSLMSQETDDDQNTSRAVEFTKKHRIDVLKPP
mmetsp:Transcript_7139/g.20159  ORF Transcript_7139/g.20159 Transcript_7139/m.20159 type:complete len:114 (-) Transcript_7139:373-714(-)